MHKAALVVVAAFLSSCQPSYTWTDMTPTRRSNTSGSTGQTTGGPSGSPQGFATAANLPSGPPVCSNNECGPAPMFPTQQCPDGQHLGGRGPCVRFANGMCGWTRMICPDPGQTACDPAACGQPLYSQWSCPDQTVGSFQCVRGANGQCGMTYQACRGFAQSSTPPLTSPPPPPPPPPRPPGPSCNPVPSAQEVSSWPIGSMCHLGGGPDPGDVRVLMSLPDGTVLVNNNGRCMRVRFRQCYTKCLPPEALIATPSGAIAIRELRVGMALWTQNKEGVRVAGIVEALSNPRVEKGHHVSQIVLADGRVIVASPEHPMLGARRMQDLQIGDEYDGVHVMDVQFLEYTGTSTYDVLPSGDTGVYWVNGVPTKSTLGP